MTTIQKPQDADILDLREKGVPATEIAALCGVTRQAINARLRRIDRAAAARQSAVVAAASEVVWDTKRALQESYSRALALLDECENPRDRLRVVAEVRAHILTALNVLDTLYTVQETREFMEEVLNVIEDLEPEARRRILARLRDKRALRSAFLPRG